MKTSPTQRSLKHLRALGFTVAITERWNPFSKTRQDLYGFIDLLCCDPVTTLAVQTTSNANVNARLEKIRSLPNSRVWLANPNRRLVIHGWAKKGPQGARKTWQLRELEVTKDML